MGWSVMGGVFRDQDCGKASEAPVSTVRRFYPNGMITLWAYNGPSWVFVGVVRR